MPRLPQRRAAVFLTGLFGLSGFFSAAPARAGGPGTSAAEFLQLGWGTRALAMGEAYTAVANDDAAMYYNPAGLAYPAVQQPNAGRFESSLSESLQFQNISMTQAGFVTRPFGLSITRVDYGQIEARTSETASPDSTFGAGDLALAFSGAHHFDGLGLSVGATGRYIEETIAQYHATAEAMDVGVLKRFSRYPISLGASIANLGTQMRFLQEAYPLPQTVRLGAAYGMTPSFPSALSAEVDFPNDSPPIMRVGFEYLGFGPLALRSGFRTYEGAQRQAVIGSQLGQTSSGLSAFYGFFMGVGLRSRFGNLDFAMEPYGDLGTSYRFSFDMRFGKVAVK